MCAQRKQPDQTPSQRPETLDVPVSNVKDVIELCRNAVRKVTQLPWVGFYPADRQRKTEWHLKGSDSDLAIARGQYWIIPLLATKIEATLYWLSASVEFDSGSSKHSTCLVNVSLRIFKGLVIEEIYPVLRIEWDCRKGYITDKHAQPHWHVYSSLLNRAPNYTTLPAFDTDSTLKDFPPKELRDFAETDEEYESGDSDNLSWTEGVKFHFAMAAHWQAPLPEPQNEVLNPTKLGIWVERCLTYVKVQLEHIDKRI